MHHLTLLQIWHKISLVIGYACLYSINIWRHGPICFSMCLYDVFSLILSEPHTYQSNLGVRLKKLNHLRPHVPHFLSAESISSISSSVCKLLAVSPQPRTSGKFDDTCGPSPISNACAGRLHMWVSHLFLITNPPIVASKLGCCSGASWSSQ